MRKLVSGAIVHGSQEENELAIKVCLELVTMCANMANIRVGAIRWLECDTDDRSLDFQISYFLVISCLRYCN